MKQKQFAAISISELVKKAGISRMGFYRNYNSKEAVLIDYFDQYVTPFYQILTQLPEKNPVVISHAYFDYVNAHSELFEVLISSGAEDILSKRFNHFVSQFYVDNVRTISFEGDYARYWNSFIAAGLFRMTIDWIKDGKQAPVDLMAKIALKVAG